MVQFRLHGHALVPVAPGRDLSRADGFSSGCTKVWMDAPASLMENGIGEFTLHRNRSEDELTVTLTGYDYTSEPGDYALPGSVTFAEGVTSLPVLFQAFDDADPDNELFYPAISDAGSYAIGGMSCALVTILDDDPQNVWFDSSSATIIEPSSSGLSSSFELTLTRNTSEGELTVLYHVVGTAEAGDYTISPSDSVTFYDGQSSTTLWITAEDDDDGDDEQLGIQLEDDPAYMAGNSASITLEDREAPVATEKEYFSFGDGTAQGNLLTDDTGNGQDSDPNGDALTVESQTTSSQNNGSVTISANGDFTYTAYPGFQGTDTFQYTVVDSDGQTAVGSATVNVSLYLYVFIEEVIDPETQFVVINQTDTASDLVKPVRLRITVDVSNANTSNYGVRLEVPPAILLWWDAERTTPISSSTVLQLSSTIQEFVIYADPAMVPGEYELVAELVPNDPFLQNQPAGEGRKTFRFRNARALIDDLFAGSPNVILADLATPSIKANVKDFAEELQGQLQLELLQLDNQVEIDRVQDEIAWLNELPNSVDDLFRSGILEVSRSKGDFVFEDESKVAEVFSDLESINGNVTAEDLTLSLQLDLDEGAALQKLNDVLANIISGNPVEFHDWILDPSNYVDKFGITAAYFFDTEKSVEFSLEVRKFKTISNWDENTYRGTFRIPHTSYPNILEKFELWLEKSPEHGLTPGVEIKIEAQF